MTICRESGPGVGASANGLALLLRGMGVRAVRRIHRHVSSTREGRIDDVSFEIHVDQALSIARQVPALQVVPAVPVGQRARRVARS